MIFWYIREVKLIIKGQIKMKLLLLIKKHLIVSILLAMIAGLILGYYVDTSWLKNLIIPLTFVLVYPMMVTLNFNSLKQKSNIKLQATTQVINFIVFPAIAFGLGYIFFQDQTYLFFRIYPEYSGYWY